MILADPAVQPDSLVYGILAAVDSWPRAMVAMTLVLAALVLVLARRILDNVVVVRRQLTSNNGGSHIKDSTDATLAGVNELRRDVAALRVDHSALAARVELIDPTHAPAYLAARSAPREDPS